MKKLIEVHFLCSSLDAFGEFLHLSFVSEDVICRGEVIGIFIAVTVFYFLTRWDEIMIERICQLLESFIVKFNQLELVM